MADKRKKLTQKEKERNAEIKKKLQKEGIIPPDKPKLNRKKFVDEAAREWNNRPECGIWEIYLVKAFGCVMAKKERGSLRVSQEAVGAAKVLKLAIRLYQFDMKMKKENRTVYPLMDKLEYIEDILDA